MAASGQTTRMVALLRGINVGTAKQVPMAVLRTAVESIGGTDVATVLRSGSVVFDVASSPDQADAGALAASLRTAVLAATGVDAEVIVLGGDEFRRVADANPLLAISTDGSRGFVTVVDGVVPGDVAVPAADDLAPERLMIGERAVYQWIPDGSMATRVPPSFWRSMRATYTTRNLNTVVRIVRLL